MRIVLVHGFNVRDGGSRTVDMLAPTLEARGHTIDKDEADYGYHNLFAVRFNHKKAVKRIARALEKADAVVDHSNGGNYVMQALYLISNKIKVVHISAALNSKVNVPAVVSSMDVLHTRNDKAVKAAKWLFWHPWGSMGSSGYLGFDTRVINYDYTYMVNAHSDWFKDDKAVFFGNKVADILEK